MSRREYVTVAEIGFAPYLLNLYQSLTRHVVDFHLTVACADHSLWTLLSRLSLDNVSPIDVREIEDAQLRQARQSRTLGEYCWTLTPFLPNLVFESRPEVAEVTYIDADMWLLRDPRPAHVELAKSGAACLVTPHAFTSEWDASRTAGLYCVQYLPFRRSGSQAILASWAEQCLQRCSSEDGPQGIGDQGYLNDWPARFGDRVVVTSHPEWFQGPWNCERFPYSDAITYHFHGLRMKNARKVWLGTNPIPSPTLRNVYQPYLNSLRESASIVIDHGYSLRFWPHPMPKSMQLASALSRLGRRYASLNPARSRSLPGE
jgi:hypothetical protein